MDLSVSGSTSQVVGDSWICDPWLGLVSDTVEEERSDELGGSGVVGELRGGLGKPSSRKI